MSDDDLLAKYGITEPTPEPGPHDELLSKYGLKEEAQTGPRMLGSRPLEDWETTPGAKGPPGRDRLYVSPLERVHQTLDPSAALPAVASDVGGNIADYAVSGAGQFSRGMGQIFATDDQGKYAGQPATGLGNATIGGLSMLTSPLTGTVKSGEDALASITGNPDFASKAALLAPIKVGGPVASTVTHDIMPATKALDMVAERMTPEALERLKSNPRLRPMDVSKGVRDLGVGIAKDTSQPGTMAPVVNSMEQSAATAKDAVRGTYDSSLGAAPPDLYQEYQRLQKQSQQVGKTQIQPALDAAGPVDASSVIANMNKVLKPGVQSVASPGVPFQTRLQSELSEWRGELTDGNSLLTDPNRLHEVQSDLRRYSDELMRSPDGQSKRLGRQLMDFRQQLVGAIDKAGPEGASNGYKDALSKYKDTKDISDAFDFGREVLKNTDDIKTDPSYLASWMSQKGRSAEEIAAAKLGARQAIEGKMGRIKSSALDPGRSGTDVPQVDFNRQKLETLFGKDATEKMFRHLQDERDIAVTNSRGLSNSTTAEAQAAQAVLKPREISAPHSNLPGWAGVIGAGTAALTSPSVGALVGGGLLAARGAKAGYDWIGRQADLSRNASVAQIISRNDPETIAKLATAMQRVSKRNKLGNL